jgi:exosortase H (IPTLxxWG-CTERM-specific)
MDPHLLKRASPAICFLVLAGGMLIALGMLYPRVMPLFQDELGALCQSTARLVSGVLELFGAETEAWRDRVSLGDFSIRIIAECTGIFEMIVFFAFVLAYPAASIKSKALGLLLGFSTIYVYNLVRILGLLLIGRYLIGSFNFFHIYLWQVTLVAIVAVSWFSWLRLIVHREPVRPV